jgi:outer membrane protein OmpA-like peptidoglycan-associated protein
MLFTRKTFAATLSAAALFTTLAAGAQEANPTSIAPGAKSATVVTQGPDGMYIYKVNVVQKDLAAVNYFNRSGSTKIDLKGTSLMPSAIGEAKVDSTTGKTKISMNLRGLTPANGFGPEYLTYVLWAISTEGRPQNLGELELAGNKTNLDVTTGFQSFALIVTAEPYFAVSAPSDVIVAENVFSDKTEGILQHVNAHTSLLPKGIYANTAGANSQENPITDREHYPLALYEAHAAYRVAKAAGADKYAPEVMARVRINLKNADDMEANKHRDIKMLNTEAREATQRAEDARIITLRKQAAERQQADKDARAAAEQNAAASQAAASQAQTEAAQAQAQADAAAAAKARADAERAKADAEAARARAEANAANASAQQSAEALKAEREKLRAQLNAILVTTETARGLVVNMSDVLFDTGKANIKPGAQTSLVKIATILQLHPDLKIQVEGYTDSVGGDDYNQKLSESRANGVHDFLIKNGVSADNVTAQGFGKSNPVADNSTAAGRAQNRRVNLVVSGPSIGVATTNNQ